MEYADEDEGWTSRNLVIFAGFVELLIGALFFGLFLKRLIPPLVGGNRSLGNSAPNFSYLASLINHVLPHHLHYYCRNRLCPCHRARNVSRCGKLKTDVESSKDRTPEQVEYDVAALRKLTRMGLRRRTARLRQTAALSAGQGIAGLSKGDSGGATPLQAAELVQVSKTQSLGPGVQPGAELAQHGRSGSEGMAQSLDLSKALERIEELQRELDGEREASAAAATATMMMMQKLQEEKAKLQLRCNQQERKLPLLTLLHEEKLQLEQMYREGDMQKKSKEQDLQKALVEALETVESLQKELQEERDAAEAAASASLAMIQKLQAEKFELQLKCSQLERKLQGEVANTASLQSLQALLTEQETIMNEMEEEIEKYRQAIELMSSEVSTGTLEDLKKRGILGNPVTDLASLEVQVTEASWPSAACEYHQFSTPTLDTNPMLWSDMGSPPFPGGAHAGLPASAGMPASCTYELPTSDQGVEVVEPLTLNDVDDPIGFDNSKPNSCIGSKDSALPFVRTGAAVAQQPFSVKHSILATVVS